MVFWIFRFSEYRSTLPQVTYLNKLTTQVASRVAKQLKTYEPRKIGNMRKSNIWMETFGWSLVPSLPLRI